MIGFDLTQRSESESCLYSKSDQTQAYTMKGNHDVVIQTSNSKAKGCNVYDKEKRHIITEKEVPENEKKHWCCLAFAICIKSFI